MSADGTIRAGVSDLPAPELDPVATPVPKPLDECRIALVTTAGLKPSGGITLWAMGDQSFQVALVGEGDFCVLFDRLRMESHGFSFRGQDRARPTPTFGVRAWGACRCSRRDATVRSIASA